MYSRGVGVYSRGGGMYNRGGGMYSRGGGVYSHDGGMYSRGGGVYNRGVGGMYSRGGGVTAVVVVCTSVMVVCTVVVVVCTAVVVMEGLIWMLVIYLTIQEKLPRIHTYFLYLACVYFQCTFVSVQLLRSCYYYSNESVTRTVRTKFCSNRGSYLVVITSKLEFETVMTHFDNSLIHGTWLGGVYNQSRGQWTWENGEPWTYDNFDMFTKSGKYLYIRKKSNSPGREWSDANALVLRRILCERRLQY